MEYIKRQVHLYNSIFVDQGIVTISGRTSGIINGLIVESSKKEASVPENQVCIINYSFAFVPNKSIILIFRVIIKFSKNGYNY